MEIPVIVAFLCVLVYLVDPKLAILLALVSPGVFGVSISGDYSEALSFVIFTIAVYFVRHVAVNGGGDNE